MKNPIPAAIVVITMTIDLAMASSNFNRISHDGWNFRISTPWGLDDHNHQVVSSDNGHPVRYGKRSERFDVRPGDCGVTENGKWSDCENDRERTEMASNRDIIYHNDDEYWYRWSLFIPKGHKNLWKTKVSYAEFKPLGCGPIFQLLETKIRSDKGEVMAYFPNADRLNSPADNWLRSYYFLTTDYINKWMDFVVHAKWSRSDDGWFQIWVNGKLKFNYKGKTMFCQKGVYFKYGVYRSFVSRNWDASKFGTIAYYDGIKISRTRDGMFEPLDE